MTRFILAVLFIILNFSLCIPLFAEAVFTTSYDTAYKISDDGSSLVTEKITLKNLTDTSYASSFSIIIGSTSVSDVSAEDEKGPMEVKVDNQGNKTTITTKFNTQVTGLDKKQTFTIRFRSKDYAEKTGKVWTVSLPRASDSPEIENVSTMLTVPLSFGDPTSITPRPIEDKQSVDAQVFTFNKEQMQKSGVSVHFGVNQIFDFKLVYPLSNLNLFPVIYQISLPPDTNFQEISLVTLNPLPENVTIDKDGNYLASYLLAPNSKQNVIATGSAKLYINSKYTDKSQSVDLQALTKKDKYWETDNPAIQTALNEIFKKEKPTDASGKAKLIYQYVVNSLKYDTSRISDNIIRLGAVTVLNNPSTALCMDFTDLFVTLSRAAGIPARSLGGFAYTQNDKLRPAKEGLNLLHSWPEYYDGGKGWVMVDPTWENTSGGIDYFNKFDLNHLTLSIKGQSSESPANTNDVTVNIADHDFTTITDPQIKIASSDSFLSAFPAKVEIKVFNNGSTILPKNTLSINTGKLSNLTGDIKNINAIPPKGSMTQIIEIKAPLVWKTLDTEITAEYAGVKSTKPVKVSPLISPLPIAYLVSALTAFLVLTYGIILFIHFKKKK